MQERATSREGYRSEERAPAPTEQKEYDTSALTAGLDEILDEIDDLLEENAEEFVRNYVQKGGQ